MNPFAANSGWIIVTLTLYGKRLASNKGKNGSLGRAFGSETKVKRYPSLCKVDRAAWLGLKEGILK